MISESILADRGRFLIKLADNEREIALAHRLRTEIFRHTDPDSEEAVPDHDRFDPQFQHLLILDRELGRTAAVCRMQSGRAALAGNGFYSEGEYEISGLRQLADETWEMSRTCVHPDYRGGTVISLLWSAIVELRNREKFRYMVGCGSVFRSSPAIGWGLFDYFKANDYLSDRVFARARPDYALPEADPAERRFFVENPAAVAAELPPLMKGYLRIGAKIAGEPVWDREFDVIDFMVFFDFEKLTARYARHFSPAGQPSGER